MKVNPLKARLVIYATKHILSKKINKSLPAASSGVSQRDKFVLRLHPRSKLRGIRTQNKQVQLLEENFNYPSLNTEKLEPKDFNLYSFRIGGTIRDSLGCLAGQPPRLTSRLTSSRIFSP